MPIPDTNAVPEGLALLRGQPSPLLPAIQQAAELVHVMQRNPSAGYCSSATRLMAGIYAVLCEQSGMQEHLLDQAEKQTALLRSILEVTGRQTAGIDYIGNAVMPLGDSMQADLQTLTIQGKNLKGQLDDIHERLCEIAMHTAPQMDITISGSGIPDAAAIDAAKASVEAAMPKARIFQPIRYDEKTMRHVPCDDVPFFTRWLADRTARPTAEEGPQYVVWTRQPNSTTDRWRTFGNVHEIAYDMRNDGDGGIKSLKVETRPIAGLLDVCIGDSVIVIYHPSGGIEVHVVTPQKLQALRDSTGNEQWMDAVSTNPEPARNAEPIVSHPNYDAQQAAKQHIAAGGPVTTATNVEGVGIYERAGKFPPIEPSMREAAYRDGAFDWRGTTSSPIASPEQVVALEKLQRNSDAPVTCSGYVENTHAVTAMTPMPRSWCCSRCARVHPYTQAELDALPCERTTPEQVADARTAHDAARSQLGQKAPMKMTGDARLDTAARSLSMAGGPTIGEALLSERDARWRKDIEALARVLYETRWPDAPRTEPRPMPDGNGMAQLPAWMVITDKARRNFRAMAEAAIRFCADERDEIHLLETGAYRRLQDGKERIGQRLAYMQGQVQEQTERGGIASAAYERGARDAYRRALQYLNGER